MGAHSKCCMHVPMADADLTFLVAVHASVLKDMLRVWCFRCGKGRSELAVRCTVLCCLSWCSASRFNLGLFSIWEWLHEI